MHRFLLLPLIKRTQLWVLVFSLAVSLPSSAKVKKRRLPAHRLTSSPSGMVRGDPWTEPTYADSTDGDSDSGEDPTIRQIAIRALGRYNGSVVIVDSSTYSIDFESEISVGHRLPAVLHLQSFRRLSCSE
jgi:hypothetical protein